MDSRRDRWLAGVTLSYSEGEGAYTHPEAAGGAVTSTLTSLNPYVHYRLNERTNLWGVLGYGVGGLTLTPDSGGSGTEPAIGSGIETDLATTMAAGAGLEVGAGLGYAVGQLAVEVNARTLVAHEDTEYEEWGFSVSIRYRPRSDGRGLSMNLGSAWGQTDSGVQSLWSRQDASGLVRGAAMDAAQLVPGGVGLWVRGSEGTRAVDAVPGRRVGRRRPIAPHGLQAHLRAQRRDGP